MSYNRLHVQLFEEIAKGKFNPALLQLSDENKFNKFFIETQIIKLITLPVEKVSDFIASNDFTNYGYKSVLDYDVQIKDNQETTKDIYLVSVKQYEFAEELDIPAVNDLKCNWYIDLMGDEFERIKIRADKFHAEAENKEKLQLYASRHIIKSRALFNDTKILLKENREKGNAEYCYIFYALGLFLIKTMKLYQEMFSLIIESSKDNEASLTFELHKAMPIKQLFKLLNTKELCNHGRQKNAHPTIIGKNSHCSSEINIKYGIPDEHMVAHPSGKCLNSNDNTQPFTGECERKLTKNAHPCGQSMKTYSKMKWNGQLNVLADIFRQLSETEVEPDMPILETTIENLRNFILNNFSDRNGNDLSFHTIRTLLNNNTSNRLVHPESPKRIKIPTIKRKVRRA